MLGIVLVAWGVAAAAYLVLKRFYAPMALLMVSAAFIVIMGFITGEPVMTGLEVFGCGGHRDRERARPRPRLGEFDPRVGTLRSS